MILWFILCSFLPIGFFLYLYIKKKFSFWSSIGLPGPKPTLFNFGNALPIVGDMNPPVNEYELVKKHGTIYGHYSGFEPILAVADAEIIKQILVKDFPLFINRRLLRVFHPLRSANQFVADGESWKRLRSITSPTFSSGKLRAMQSMMDRCVDKLVKYLEKLVDSQNGILNTRKVFVGFTMDVISSTSFATETNANDDRSEHNPIVQNGLQLEKISSFQALSHAVMPAWFNRLAKVQHLFNPKSLEFFCQFVKEIMVQRQNSNQNAMKRNDLMQLLIDAYVYEDQLEDTDYDKLAASDGSEEIDKSHEPNMFESSKKTKSKLSEVEIIAQSLLFFSAGFGTTSNALSNCIFELVQNPDIQEQLFDELEQTLGDLDQNSDIYYETVMMHLPYLDAVIKETLRKYPALVRLERRYSGEDGFKLAGYPLVKDQLIEISTYAVHYNPEYYPDPHQFNPSRFMPENKHLLVPYTYIPFGAGPRNCVGMRFAYQEMKLCLAKIVRKFRFSKTENTPSSLQFIPYGFTVTIKHFETKVDRR